MNKYNIDFLTTGSFPHDNFSSVYWIFNKLGHMIPLWKAKDPIYFGVIRSKVKVTVTINRIFLSFDNLYRRAYFVMHTFLVQLCHGENKLIFNEMMMRSALF